MGYSRTLFTSASNVSEALECALSFALAFVDISQVPKDDQGDDGAVEVELNTNFTANRMTSLERAPGPDPRRILLRIATDQFISLQSHSIQQVAHFEKTVGRLIGKADAATGSTTEIKLPENKNEMDKLTPAQLAAYEKVTDLANGNPLPWGQGPRRMGTDKNADVLWVGNSWGGNLARIDTRTLQTTYVPLPDPGSQQPYHVTVDRDHNAWTNIWMTDQVMRYSPATSTWTAFDLPTRGIEVRYVSLLERDGGATQVILPSFRTRKIAVMTLRSEQDVQALRTAAQ